MLFINKYISFVLKFFEKKKKFILLLKIFILLIINIWLLVIFWKILLVPKSIIINNNILLLKISLIFKAFLNKLGYDILTLNVLKMLIITTFIVLLNLLILYYNKIILLVLMTAIARYSYKSYLNYLENCNNLNYMGFTNVKKETVGLDPLANTDLATSLIDTAAIAEPSNNSNILIWLALGAITLVGIVIIIWIYNFKGEGTSGDVDSMQGAVNINDLDNKINLINLKLDNISKDLEFKLDSVSKATNLVETKLKVVNESSNLKYVNSCNSDKLLHLKIDELHELTDNLNLKLNLKTNEIMNLVNLKNKAIAKEVEAVTQEVLELVDLKVSFVSKKLDNIEKFINHEPVISKKILNLNESIKETEPDPMLDPIIAKTSNYIDINPLYDSKNDIESVLEVDQLENKNMLITSNQVIKLTEEADNTILTMLQSSFFLEVLTLCLKIYKYYKNYKSKKN